jgi:AcrR family transcriptional regulator
MPYPSQTDRATIVQTARELIEQDGVEQLSLARVAGKLGIKAPSLYRHVDSKSALLQAVNTLTFEEMFQAYQAALRQAGPDPRACMLAIARAHRAYAQAHPETYVLAYTATAPEDRTDPAALEQAALPLQVIMAEIAGEALSLTALRGALALVHGFVMLELKNQLQRGGDLGEAYEEVVGAYLEGWRRKT